MSRRVFISSARGDSIDAYRAAAVEGVSRRGFVPVSMEDLNPGRPESAEWCRKQVRGCDTLILVLAHKYGTTVPDEEISYTELEYRTAVADPDKEILVWVVDPDLPWRPAEIDDGPARKRLTALKQEVSDRHTVRSFGAVDDFKVDLAHALGELPKVEQPDPAFSLTSTNSFNFHVRAPEPVTIPRYVGDAVFTGRADELGWLDSWAASADPVAVVEAIGGTGKSALTWKWFHDRAAEVVPGLAGRFWWSFYESSNSLTKFQQRLLQYTTGCSADQTAALAPVDLGQAVLEALARRPFVVVMDGAERLLNAYHRFDAGSVSDDEVSRLRLEEARTVTDPVAYDFLRELPAIGQSRVVLSSRLLPDAFLGRAQTLLRGVRHTVLAGLSTAEAQQLLATLGVRASLEAVRTFFEPLDNHPLLIGVVAGLVADYREAPDDFDVWLEDPAHGQAFNVSSATATELSDRILKQALDGLDAQHLALLQGIAFTGGPSSWEMVNVINPYAVDSPQRRATGLPEYIAKYLAERDARRGVSVTGVLSAKLTLALEHLEARGLLWWNRGDNTYDMHPVVRSYIAETADGTLRVATHRKLVRDHFGRTPEAREETLFSSVEELKPQIDHFRALFGAELYKEAADFWGKQLALPLLFGLEANTTVLELLRPVEQRRIGGRLGESAAWDLALAERSAGRVRSAHPRTLMVLATRLASPEEDSAGDRGWILPALGNAIQCSFQAGRSADAHAYVHLLESLTSAWGDHPSDLARARGWRGALLRRAGRYEEALDTVKELQSGPPCEFQPHWTSRLIQDEYELLRLLGRSSSLGGLELTGHRFGDHPAGRAAWADLVFRIAMDADDLHTAQSAAEQTEYWERRAGREVIRARTAWALARLEHLEAEREFDEACRRLDRLDPELRPHLILAKAALGLGRQEAAKHAALAYEQAWEDGPGYHAVENVREASNLLDQLALQPPALRSGTVQIEEVPLGPELLELLDEVRMQRNGKQ